MNLAARILAFSVATVLTLSLLPTPETHAASDAPACEHPSSPQVFGTTCGESVQVSTRNSGAEGGAESSSSQVPDGPRDRYQRHAVCVEWMSENAGGMQRTAVWEGAIPPCVEEYVPVLEECPEQTPVLPQWVSRVVDPEGPTYGPWQTLTAYECPEDPLPAAIAQAWREMTISPQAIEVLPDQGWAVALTGIKADLDESPQTSTVSVLGTDVVLRATPIDEAWTVTDVITGDSGPGIFETAHHGEEVILFDRRQQRVRLGLTTTWEGHYSLNSGTTWVPAPGTATTTSEPLSMHVYHPRARLVNCDTMGNCMSDTTSKNPFTLTDPDADGIDNYLIPDDKIGHYLDQRAKDRRWRDTERVNES